MCVCVCVCVCVCLCVCVCVCLNVCLGVWRNHYSIEVKCLYLKSNEILKVDKYIVIKKIKKKRF